MGVFRMRARSLLRRKVWGTVAVALLVAVAGGAVLVALAGARRTESAYPRLLEGLHSADVLVFPRQFELLDTAKLARLPNVEQVGTALGFGLTARKADGTPSLDFSTGAAASPDGVAFYDVERFRLLDGRMPDPSRVREILVNETAARTFGLRIGSTFRSAEFNLDKLSNAPADLTAEQQKSYFTPLDLRVTGIGRSLDEMLNNENQDQQLVVLTPAFARRFGADASYALAGVRLRHGARDLAPFEAAVRRAFPNVQFQLTTREGRASTFASAVRPYVDSLRLFAAVAALAALFVVGQAVARLVGADAADGEILDALGATRRQRAVISTPRAVTAVVVGAILAGVLCVAASPLFPLGAARAAEPSPGVRVDVAVLAGGIVAIVAVLVGLAAFVAWRLARASGFAGVTEERWRPSRVTERLAAMGASASAVAGVRAALQRDRTPGGASLPTTVFGLVVAIATIVAALTFGSTLDRMVTTPARYGWSWDALVDTYDSGTTPKLVSAVAHDRDLSAVTVGRRGNVTLEGHVLPAFGFSTRRGAALPVATEGRFPSAPDEVALGAQTLRDLGTSVGDTIEARSAGGEVRRLHVVGRTLLPSLSLNGTFGIGEGVALTGRGLLRLDAGADPSFFLVDLEPGVRIATINRRYGATASALGPQRPGDVRSYSRVRATPVILASLLAVLGAGVLAHQLLSQVGRRRRDLAILKTMGFSRRQVAATVAWQATTLVVVALVLALPVGVVFGRWTWRKFSDVLGVDASVAIPTFSVALTVVVSIALANLIAAFPARAAARTRPALVLRSE